LKTVITRTLSSIVVAKTILFAILIRDEQANTRHFTSAKRLPSEYWNGRIIIFTSYFSNFLTWRNNCFTTPFDGATYDAISCKEHFRCPFTNIYFDSCRSRTSLVRRRHFRFFFSYTVANVSWRAERVSVTQQRIAKRTIFFKSVATPSKMTSGGAIRKTFGGGF